MKTSAKQYAQALYESIQETNPKDQDKVLDNLVTILSQNGDLNKVEQIEAEYLALQNLEKGVKDVKATFAAERNTKILEGLNSVIQGKPQYSSKIKEDIIGGVVVRVDDTLIDGSIKTQLDNLNQELKQ